MQNYERRQQATMASYIEYLRGMLRRPEPAPAPTAPLAVLVFRKRRLPPKPAEDDLLDIPDFLRRQS